MNKEIPSKNPYIVFVFAVAAIAGIISIGNVFPIKPFTASIAFIKLKKVMTDQIGKMPTIINIAVMR